MRGREYNRRFYRSPHPVTSVPENSSVGPRATDIAHAIIITANVNVR